MSLTRPQHTGCPDPMGPHHEHAWATESVHPTSEGRVRYVRCGTCDVRRVDLQPTSTLPPIALSCWIGGSKG